MDVRFINPFVVATTTVFKTMLNIDLTMSKPLLRKTRESTGDVTGVMGLAGDAKGTICLGFTKEGAIFAYRSLTGDGANDMSPDVVDAIGELTNIISGQARKELEKAQINLKAGIPSVVVGKGVELHFMSALPIASLPFQFQTDNGPQMVHVDFSFE